MYMQRDGYFLWHFMHFVFSVEYIYFWGDGVRAKWKNDRKSKHTKRKHRLLLYGCYDDDDDDICDSTICSYVILCIKYQKYHTCISIYDSNNKYDGDDDDNNDGI